MTTVQDLINNALSELGVIAAGESPATEDTALGLSLLNALLDSWSANALPIPSLVKDSSALTGQSSYQFTVRPLLVKAVHVIAGGITVPYKIVTPEEWSTGDTNRVAYYDAAFPTGTINLRPAPTGTLEVFSYKPLTKFSATTDTLATVLPPGYTRALMLCLAVDLANAYNREPSQSLVALSESAKKDIFQLNAATLGLPVPQPPTPQGA